MTQVKVNQVALWIKSKQACWQLEYATHEPHFLKLNDILVPTYTESKPQRSYQFSVQISHHLVQFFIEHLTFLHFGDNFARSEK